MLRFWDAQTNIGVSIDSLLEALPSSEKGAGSTSYFAFTGGDNKFS